MSSGFKDVPSGLKGFRGLAILVGVFGVLFWLVGLPEVVTPLPYLDPTNLATFLVGILFYFFVPWGFVRAVGWVVQGFQKDREPRP